MIRDDYKDVKKVTSRENRKKTSMGERNYYAKQIPRIKDFVKAFGFFLVSTDVIMCLAWAAVLLIYIANSETLTSFIVWTSIFGALVAFNIVWYAFLKPHNLKKAERYKAELERLSSENLGKIAGAYKIYGSDYKNYSGQPEKTTEE